MFGLLLAGLAQPAHATTITVATIYSVTDLGNRGGNLATARSIAPNGYAAGTANDPSGTNHALVANPNAIGVPVHMTGDSATASGINSSGQVAGTEWFDGKAYATLWGVTDATYTLLAGPGSYANAVNEAGLVTGMLTVGNEGHLFTTGIDNHVIDLGTMPGSAWSSGYGINNRGEIAGYAMVGSQAQAFVWDSKNGYSALEGLGGQNSYAMGISDKGGIAGSAQLSSGYMRAVLWLHGVVHDLGTLGGNNSYAYGVNNESQVVGYSFTSNGKEHAFVYSDGLMLDLNSLISPDSGWVLTQAFGINDAGQIAGTGLLYGKVHAFRLDLKDLILHSFGLSGPGGFGGPGGGGGGGNDPQFFAGPNGPLSTQASTVPEPGSGLLALCGVALIFIGVAGTKLQAK